MAQLPPASAPAVPLVVVAYDLRDGSNAYASLAIDGVDLLPSASIRHLRRVVFDAARALLPERYSYLNLDVYPPGSSNVDLSARNRAARPRDSIASVLAKASVADDDTLIIVARPLPATAGIQGEQR